MKISAKRAKRDGLTNSMRITELKRVGGARRPIKV